jgi:hypothetical protein
MFKRIVLLVAALAMVCVGFVAPEPVPARAGYDYARVPLIRLYNARTNDHLYTISRQEANDAYAHGYRIEGEMGYVYDNGQWNNGQDWALIYRLRNPRNGKHFYTTDGQENAAAVASGYVLEGLIGAIPRSAGDSEPMYRVYRLYNRSQNKHFYTVDYNERTALLSKGYVAEGALGGWIFGSSAPTPSGGGYRLDSNSFLPNVTIGQSYYTTARLTYLGSTATYTTARFRNMPAGLTGYGETNGYHNPGDVLNYAITGYPSSQCSNCAIYLDISDSTGNLIITYSLYLTISGATPTPVPTMSITTDYLVDATVGQPYSAYIQVNGGMAPYTWSTLSTTYPSGCCVLGLSGNAQPIYGSTVAFNTQSSNTVLGPAGTYSWVIKVTDANGLSVAKTVYLTVNPGTSSQPTLTITSPTQGAYRAGDTVYVTWSRSGTFDMSNRYYFVYLKTAQQQLLGSSNYPGSYNAIIFRSSDLPYPAFSFAMPNVAPGQYYIELDYTDTSGLPLTSHTSQAITVY